MNRFYFDHNATTPVSAEVGQAYLPMLSEVYGNASSIHHYGQAAKQRLEWARREVALLVGCDAREIVFLSGGTEADNLALLGTARLQAGKARHIITSAIEHPAVLSACAQLEREGVAVTRVPAGADGLVDPDDIRRALRPETGLISLMHANNELGTIQPLEAVARVAREAGVLVHSDGVQAAGKLPVDVRALGVDLYSASGHKVYAPKGIGFLYVRRGVELAPLLYGGHQEGGVRPGTDNVAGAVALGAAAAWIRANLETESARVCLLRDRLERLIEERVPDVRVNAAGAPRTPNTTNMRFDGIEGEALLIALDLAGFAVSSGAACSSGAVEPSHVLTAVGLTRQQARSSLRFSLGRSNDEAQVDALADAVASCAGRLRRLSPAYRHG